MTIAISKADMIEKLKKANAASTLLVTDQAESFLFDIIENSDTLKKLNVQYKDQTSGNIEALEAQTRKTRKYTYVEGQVPTGNFDANKREVPYNVEKIYLDMWLKNDDVWYILRQRGQNIETALTSMMQESFALDMQDLLFNGDKDYTGPDQDFIQIIDGFIKKMKKSTKCIHLTDKLPTPGHLIEMKRMIDSKYYNHPKFNFNWILSENTKLDLQKVILERPTDWADSVIVDGELKKILGYPIEVVSTYPDNFIAFTPMSNLQPVFTRDVRYNNTSTGVECVKRDATYHILFAYIDAVVNNMECVAWLDYTRPTTFSLRKSTSEENKNVEETPEEATEETSRKAKNK